MSKPRVIIADEDEGYIIPLQHKFATEYTDLIDLEIITDKDYYSALFSNPQNADVLIISEGLYDSSIQRHNISNVFVMMDEDADDTATGELNINRLNKYTSVKEIFNEIISKSSRSLNISAVDNKDTQIILVTSASGGVGKTTVALGLAGCLTRNYKRVLYINACNLQNFQFYMNNPEPVSSTEVYSRLLNADEKIYNDLKHVIRKESFSYLPAFKAALISLGLNDSVYGKIALSAKKSSDYDYIVIDAESTFNECKAELINISDRVIIVTDQSAIGVKSTNNLVSNINGIGSDKYVFVCNKFDKNSYNAIVSNCIALKFNINEYIEKMTVDDKTKLEDLADADGMKKLSFMLI